MSVCKKRDPIFVLFYSTKSCKSVYIGVSYLIHVCFLQAFVKEELKNKRLKGVYLTVGISYKEVRSCFLNV